MKVHIVYDKERFSKGGDVFGGRLALFLKQKNVDSKIIFSDDMRAGDAPEELPKLVIMRTFDADISRFYEKAGVRVMNTAQLSTVANDKWATYLFAVKHGIAVASTELISVGQNYPLSDFGGSAVFKTRFGHGGTGIFEVNSDSDIDKAFAATGESTAILQKRLTDTADIRAYVIGGELKFAMRRTAKTGFRSNYSLGGRAELTTLSLEENSLVQKAIDQVMPDFAGIDIMHDGSIPILSEIEDVVGCRMVYENTELDPIKMYAEYIAREL